MRATSAARRNPAPGVPGEGGARMRSAARAAEEGGTGYPTTFSAARPARGPALPPSTQ